MPLLLVLVKGALYLLMALTIVAAMGVVFLPNLFHAALALVMTLIGIAGIYLALQADFLAMVQILLYVGAVMTLVIFAIMLTQRFGDRTLSQYNPLSLSREYSGVKKFFLAVVAFGSPMVFMIALSRVILATPWPVKEETLAARVTTYDLGQALMGTYVFPFEMISVVLIGALIGAIVIAKKEKA